MKTAIMTWFHYHNYGTALQVVALNKKIRELSGDSDVIDYEPVKMVVKIPSKRKNLVQQMYGFVYKRVKRKLRLSKAVKIYSSDEREEKFLKYYNKHLSFSKKCDTLSDLENLNNEYDAFICGSDQIWSPLCFDSHYFLDFVKDTKKMIAYAPSIGKEKIDDRYITSRIGELAKRFNHISTREKKGSELLEGIINKKVETVLDPTLLLTAEEWIDTLDVADSFEKKPYLLAYFLGNNENYWNKTYKVAELLDLEVKIIPVFSEDSGKKGCISEPVGPEEFVELIRNSSYICTDSFHGTIFAINFKKDFCVFERFKKGDSRNQNLRIYNILNLLGLNDRLYTKNKDITMFLDAVQYEKVHLRLQEERIKSYEFLKKSVENVKNSKEEKMLNHIRSSGSLCCGCGACANACPVAAIEIKMNDDGFYTAAVDQKKCISCGKCNAACPFRGEIKECGLEEGQLYSFKDNDLNILNESSSGGFAYRLSEKLLKKGWAVVGCAFDKKNQRAHHIMVTKNNADDLKLLQGSKYLQSDFSGVVPLIRECESPVVIFGTPCQIAGAKRLFRGRNDILYVDLICHGVPSSFLYEKYKIYLNKKYHMCKEDISVSFRYKVKGWKPIHLCAKDSQKSVSTVQTRDYYFRMFEKGHCYSPSCYDCRWRDKCEADIRIGDYWGERFAEDNTGVSMVLSMTDKGDGIINMLDSSKCGDIKKQPIEDYLMVQQVRNAPKPVFYKELLTDLKNDNVSFNYIINKYVMPFDYNKTKLEKVIWELLRYVQK